MCKFIIALLFVFVVLLIKIPQCSNDIRVIRCVKYDMISKWEECYIRNTMERNIICCEEIH